MKKLMAKLNLLRKVDSSDLFFLSGSGAISYGAWMIYPPAGVILAGIFLVILSVSVSKPKAG
jgi:hypothetical protein